MRIVDLQTFLALARLRHFGKAAEELNTTQPAISMRLAGLERELGTQLIVRGEGQFELTEHGKLARDSFETMLSGLGSLRSRISGSAVGPGHVRIGAIDAISSTILPDLVENLSRQQPLLRIDLTVDSTVGLLSRMHQGELDLSFALDPVVDEGFRSYVACVFEMSWIGSSLLIDPQRLYAVEELADMPIITFPIDTPPYRMIAPYFQDENTLAEKRTSSNSLYAMINLVIDGFGVAAIPTVVVRRELDSGLLHKVRVAKPFPPMPIVASYHPLPDPALIEAVVSQARKSARHFCDSVDSTMAWIPG